MLDKANPGHATRAMVRQQGLKPCLAIGKRLWSQVGFVIEQKVESIEDQVVGILFRQCRPQSREIRSAVLVEGNDLAVYYRIGQRLGLSCDRIELPRPIEPLTRLQGHVSILHTELNTIAIELDLVSPAIAGRRPLDRLAELGRYEVRKRSRGSWPYLRRP